MALNSNSTAAVVSPIKVYNGLSDAPDYGCAVHLAIGMFDGVHHGHQAVIDAAVHAASRSGGVAGVLTFDPHPSRLFRPEDPTLLIQDPVLKIRRLATLGLDFVLIQRFDRGFAAIAADEFLATVKRALPRLAAVYVGENFRFGAGRKGDVSVLVECARDLQVRVFSAERVRWDGEPISSTRLRALIRNGDIAVANEMLGYHYESLGTVVPGKKLGGKIGFSTLNFEWNPECRPRSGVYVVRLRPYAGKGDISYPGIANYGFRPTVDRDATVPLLEVHCFVPPDLTVGDRAIVEWHRFIRPEMKFDSVEALARQIAGDCRQAREYWRLPRE